MTGLSQCTKERATDELRFWYDGYNLIATLSSQLSTLNSFAWGLDLSGSLQGAGGIGGLLWMNNGLVSTHFVSYDGNGNVTALVNAADGSESARYEYGPFGEVIRASGPAAGSMVSANPFRFSTKYQDDESDLLYYGYRYYNASTGRWLSRDPIGEPGFDILTDSCTKAFASRSKDQGRNSKAGSEITRQNQLLAARQQQNPYSFVHNEPLTKVDLLGLFTDSGVKICYEAGWGLGQHRWIEYPGGSAGFYPDESGIWPGGPGTIQSPDPHTGDSDKHCDPIGLLPCCDKKKFLKCIADRIAQDADTPPWYNVPDRTCQWWADVVVKDCLKECRK